MLLSWDAEGVAQPGVGQRCGRVVEALQSETVVVATHVVFFGYVGCGAIIGAAASHAIPIRATTFAVD